MAIPTQASTWASQTIGQANNMLDLMAFLRLHSARATLNNLAAILTDSELAASGPFAHLTQAELVDVVTVFNEYLTWIGDPAVGTTRAAKLAKMAG